jgi:hypothetical protein
MPEFLLGTDLYVDKYLWPGIVSYVLLVRQNFVVCHDNVFDRLGCAVGEELSETLTLRVY